MTFWQRKRVWIWVLVLLVLVLLVLHTRTKTYYKQNWLDQVIMQVSAPFQHAIVWTVDGCVNIWKDYVWLRALREKNKELVHRLDKLEDLLETYKEIEIQNRRLRKLVNMRETRRQTKVKTARVVGVGTFVGGRVIRINAGSTHGVQIGNAVTSGSGLVGRISGVVSKYAEVLLIVDSRSSVDAVVQRSRERGIVHGQGKNNLCILDHVVRTADVEVGDRIITSGIGEVFPKGLLIGTISSVTSPRVGVFRCVELIPAVMFSKLEEVMVLIDESTEKTE